MQIVIDSDRRGTIVWLVTEKPNPYLEGLKDTPPMSQPSARPAMASLKLFVWKDCLMGDYTEGVMFALAHDVAEARDLLVREGSGVADGVALAREPLVVTEPWAFGVRGGA
jgi:hypothetical protein